MPAAPTQLVRPVLCLLWILPSALVGFACEPKTIRKTFSEPSSERSYDVVLREGRDLALAAPVLVVLHPYATDPQVMIDAWSIEHNAISRDWLLVVPRGGRDGQGNLAWNASAACCWTGTAAPDDVGYLDGVLADVKRRFNVDPKAIYALGSSNGAFMAHRWACEPTSALTKIVAIAGAAPGPDDPPCRPARHVDVLHIHGDQDAVIHYEGGVRQRHRYPSAEQTVRAWCDIDQCTHDFVDELDSSLFWGSIAIRSQKGPNARVSFWTALGAGHNMHELRHRMERVFDFLSEE